MKKLKADRVAKTTYSAVVDEVSLNRASKEIRNKHNSIRISLIQERHTWGPLIFDLDDDAVLHNNELLMNSSIGLLVPDDRLAHRDFQDIIVFLEKV